MLVLFASQEESDRTDLESILSELKIRGDPKAVAGMARYGIRTKTAFGVSVPQLRAMSREIGLNHRLAQQLWNTGIHEARLLAAMIDNPSEVDEAQMDEWASEFDSWDIVDGTCGNLFDKTRFAVKKAHEWSKRKEEFVKRAGFVLMAELAVHDKTAEDRIFVDFLPLITREAMDDRNFVRKAVNWALRQIGKRNETLNIVAIQTCKELELLDTKPARWISADALRELKSESVQRKLMSSRIGSRTETGVSKKPKGVVSSRRTR